MPKTIAKDVVATFHYTLTNDAGEEMDTSKGGEPLTYLHGYDNIVPGLERELAGKEIGATAEVVVEPVDGYGVHDPTGKATVAREAFPPEIEVGQQFAAEDDDGQLMPVWVAGFDDDEVHIDTNHPLAGVRLHFAVEVVELRAANEDELTHGHPHGRSGDEGHHH
jgi:FKBP-type peptidyl-prolyl cis-trans isomerase SlyD